MSRRTVAMLLALLFVFGACARERGPDRTVRRFFRAMNEKDMNQVLSCIDPRQERLFKASFRLIEKATGFPLDDLFEIMPGIQQAFAKEMRNHHRFTTIRIRSRSVSGATARLTVSVKSGYSGRGIDSTKVEEFEFTLENFEEVGWRIVDVRSASTAAAD